jgi:hypothetical protein
MIPTALRRKDPEEDASGGQARSCPERAGGTWCCDAALSQWKAHGFGDHIGDVQCLAAAQLLDLLAAAEAVGNHQTVW